MFSCVRSIQHHIFRGVRGLLFVHLAVAFFSSATYAASSKGTDFWFAFPKGNALSVSELANVGIIISGPPGTSGSITVPSISAPAPIPFTLNTEGYYKWTSGTISATSDAYQTSGNDAVGSRYVHLTSTAAVSVQVAYEASSGSTNPSVASWQAIPTDALGKEYYVLAYGNPPVTSAEGTEFVVVGTVNATTVTINPTAAIGSRSAGSSYQITLNQGDTYRATNLSANGDLSGTLITASQPIAVISGHSCALIPTSSSVCSTVLEQLFPTSGWSRNFILSPFAAIPPGTSGDRIRIVANSNGTVVNINSTATVNLDRGGLYETNLTSTGANPDPTVITSNFPIMVAQYAKDSTSYSSTNSEEPAMLLVPGYDHYVTGATFNLPINGYNNYINLVTPSSQIGTMTLDGSIISSASFSAVGTTGYSRAILQVSPTGGTTNGNHTLTAGLPFGVMAYGFGSGSALKGFGSIAAFNMPTIPQASSVTLSPSSGKYLLGTRACYTATLLTNTGTPVNDASVTWVASGVNPSTITLSTDNTGTVTRCYTGTVLGTDTLVANASASNMQSSSVTLQWIKVNSVDLIASGQTSAKTGTTLCTKATVKDNNGAPISGSTVTFAVSGANASTGSGTSDSNGSAEYCYSGKLAGKDSVLATVDGVQSLPLSLQWIKVSSVDLIPSAQNSATTGSTLCAQATVKDNNGAPIAGTNVSFTITGANRLIGSGISNQNGMAEYCYSSNVVGKDTVVASADSVSSSNLTFDWLSPLNSISLNSSVTEAKMGNQVCVSAKALSALGNGIANLEIGFAVSGANTLAGSSLTNSSGVATYCYLPGSVGVDRITANSGSISSDSPVTVTVAANPNCDVVSTESKSTFLHDVLSNCLMNYAKRPDQVAYGLCQSNAWSSFTNSVQSSNTKAGCLASNVTGDKANQLISALDQVVQPILQEESATLPILGVAKGLRRYSTIAFQISKTMETCFSSGGSFNQPVVTDMFESLFALSGKPVLSISARAYVQSMGQSCRTILSL